VSIINEVLEQSGLDAKETSVYSTLLSNGGLTVLEIAKKANLKRTNLYNILENLKQLNLVKEVKEAGTTKYYPQSPRQIETLLERKSQMLNHAKLNYDILVSSLQSQFTLIEKKPLITYFEGIKGLQRLYDDVNDTGKDILLLRSTFDDKRKDVDALVSKQIVEQVKRGIHAKVIGPLEDVNEAKTLYSRYDKARLVEERFIKNFPFNLPAQILIYGNKTAISTIREDIIITVIDHKDVTDTYRVLFDFIWEYSTAEHNQVVSGWRQD
jgi:sugar-specific transcriptional regulator TrmB